MSHPSAGSKVAASRFSWHTALYLAIVFLLAFIARAFEYSSVFPDGRLSLLDTDPFYHMRRVWMTIAHYPRVCPFFDYYMAYPLGGAILWPPLFDFAIATLAMIVGLGSPSVWTVEHVAAFFPVVVGAATIVPTYFIAKHLFGKPCGLLSSAILALLPASISTSVVGRVDHHVLGVFVSACFLLAMLRAVAGRQRMRWVAGLLLGLTFLSWPGANLFVVIIVCFYTVELIRCYTEPGEAKALLKLVIPVLLVVLVLLSPYAKYSGWMDSTVIENAPIEEPAMPYMGLSRFHVAFVLASAIFVCYGYLLLKRLKERGAGRLLFSLVFVALPLLVMAVLYALGLLEQMRAALDYVGGKDPWLSTIAECQPLFCLAGRFDTARAEVSFGYGIYLFPISVLLILRCLAQRDSHRRDLVLFVVWSLTMSCLVLAKNRFADEFAICFAVALSYLVLEAARKIGAIAPIPSWRRGAAWAGFLAAVLLSVFPMISYFTPLSERLRRAAMRFQTMPAYYREAMDFLREQTPPTSYYEEPTRKPEYGVLAEWSYGEWILCVGRRPVTASCQGTYLGRAKPFRDSARFLFLESEEEAVVLLKRDEVRFVMTTYFAKNLLNYYRIAGVELSAYVARRRGEQRLVLKPTQRYFRAMGARLHEFDGRAFRLDETGELLPALEHFRLIYEGEPDEEIKDVPSLPCLKIFEFVEGARVRGRARPQAKVEASVCISTNRGRAFQYIASASASEGGAFELVVPYSTANCPYRTQAATAYLISCGTASTTLEVPEEALEGGIVTCDLPGAAAPQ